MSLAITKKQESFYMLMYICYHPDNLGSFHRLKQALCLQIYTRTLTHTNRLKALDYMSAKSLPDILN